MNKLTNALILASLTASLISNSASASTTHRKEAETSSRAGFFLIVQIEPKERSKRERTPETPPSPTCNEVSPYPEIILSDYQDGDTPYPTYYQDYLGDYFWWVEYSNLCETPRPEPDPEQ